MKLLLVTLFLAPWLHADLRSTGRPISILDYYVDGGTGHAGFGGDTYHFTAWTGSGTGGNFNGGHVYGTYNDGHGCSGGGNLGFLEIVTLDWSTKSNTQMSCVNSMTSFGGSGADLTPGGWLESATSWKSTNPFSSGNVYLPVDRQNANRVSMTTIILSPDKGLHWCNQATYNTGGNGGAHSCDAGNWQANGDAPPDKNTAMMWGTEGVYTGNPQARLTHIQFCQDEACTGSPYDADNYLYFIGTSGDAAASTWASYASCVAKAPTSIMDGSQWWYYTGGNGTCGDVASWTHTIGSAVPILRTGISGPNQFFFPSSAIYIPQSGQILITGHTTNRVAMYASDAPWGTPRLVYNSPTDDEGAFTATNLAWLDSSCAGCNTNPGQWQITFAASKYGHTLDASLYLYKLVIANRGPGQLKRAPAGRTPIGTTALRIAKDGSNGAVISRGLVRAYTFDSHLDLDSSYWTGAKYGTYAGDMTGSGNCLAQGNTATGAIVWGSQSGTAGVAPVAAGITHGGSLTQFSGSGGTCAGTQALPLSGDAAFTIQMLVKPTDITTNQQPIFQISDPANFGNDKQIFARINHAAAGGTHVDVGTAFGSRYSTVTVSWATGNYYLLTITRAAGGIFDASQVKVYLGTTLYSGSNSGTSTGNPVNLPATTRLTVFCAENPANLCDLGTQAHPSWPGTVSYVALYNRELSADEIRRNYAAIKAAMARSPRSVTVQ